MGGQLRERRSHPCHAGSPPTPQAPDRLLDALDVEHALPLGLAEDLGQRLVRQHLSEVDERPLHGGDRDAVHARDVVAVEAPPPVDSDPLGASPLGRRADVDPHPAAVPQPVKRRGIAVAQDRLSPDRQDRGEPVAVRAQVRMADGVDAAVESHELAARKPLLDDRLADPGIEELAAGDHAMLARREPADPLIWSRTAN